MSRRQDKSLYEWLAAEGRLLLRPPGEDISTGLLALHEKVLQAAAHWFLLPMDRGSAVELSQQSLMLMEQRNRLSRDALSAYVRLLERLPEGNAALLLDADALFRRCAETPALRLAAARLCRVAAQML